MQNEDIDARALCNCIHLKRNLFRVVFSDCQIKKATQHLLLTHNYRLLWNTKDARHKKLLQFTTL